MMPGGRVDGVVRSRPTHRRREFREDMPVRGVLPVLAQGPPAAAAGFLDGPVRAVQQRDPGGEKIERPDASRGVSDESRAADDGYGILFKRTCCHAAPRSVILRNRPGPVDPQAYRSPRAKA